MVNEDMDDDLAFDITEVLYDGKAGCRRSSRRRSRSTRPRGVRWSSPVELHPGAERFYEEQGG